MLPAGEFLFDGWLRFTISAGLYKVVAWLMMAIVYNGALPGIQNLVQQVAMQSGTNSDEYYATNYLSMLALALVCGIGAFMMWQVPDIAKGLVTGGGSGSVKRIRKRGDRQARHSFHPEMTVTYSRCLSISRISNKFSSHLELAGKRIHQPQVRRGAP